MKLDDINLDNIYIKVLHIFFACLGFIIGFNLGEDIFG
jgi:hypothetical protein